MDLHVTATTRSDLAKRATAVIQVSRLSTRQRFLRAAQFLGLFWAIAVFCVLIPALHFVLVPGFLLVGAFMSVHAFGTEQRLDGGEVVCLKCGHVIPLKVGPFNWPLKEICPACGLDLSLEKSDRQL